MSMCEALLNIDHELPEVFKESAESLEKYTYVSVFIDHPCHAQLLNLWLQ